MILRRYMTKQVAGTTSVVLGFLVFLLLGGRLIRYFGIAAEGNLDISLLFSIIGYNLPYFLELILPLAFFIALMLVFGRLYVDNEMAVINSSGLSRSKLLLLLAPFILLLFIIESWLSMVGKPWGVRQADSIWEQQALKSAFDLIKPGEFISNGDYHLYVGSLQQSTAQKQAELRDVILIKTAGKDEVESSADQSEETLAKSAETPAVTDIDSVNNADAQMTSEDQQSKKKAEQKRNQLPEDVSAQLAILPINLSEKDTLILAKSAQQVTTDVNSGKTQLDMFNGRRYEISAHSRNYNQVSFGQYRITLTENKDEEETEAEVEVQTLAQLWQSLQYPHQDETIRASVQAELGYRFALPWLIVLASMFALPLSRVQPRQGRWLKLVPAILLFVCVALVLISLKKPISDNKLAVAAYPISIVVMMVLALYMNLAHMINQRILYKLAAAKK